MVVYEIIHKILNHRTIIENLSLLSNNIVLMGKLKLTHFTLAPFKKNPKSFTNSTKPTELSGVSNMSLNYHCFPIWLKVLGFFLKLLILPPSSTPGIFQPTNPRCPLPNMLASPFSAPRLPTPRPSPDSLPLPASSLGSPVVRTPKPPLPPPCSRQTPYCPL